MSEASLSIDGIIHLVDPQKKTHVGLNAFLQVLSFGLGFLPGIGPEIEGVSKIAIAAATIALEGIKAAPGIAQQIWPVGTQNSQPTQIDELQNNIPLVLTELQANLQNGLKNVQGVNQSDVSSFLAFTGDGNFSVSQGSAPNFEAAAGTSVQPLLLAFTTYLVSTALAQNGWHALILPGIDPWGYSNGTASTCPSWGNGCHGDTDLQCDGYDQYGQCNGTYWWYSRAHNSAYTLNHNNKDSSTDIIQTIFSNGWSTGPLLFENAAICEMQNMLQQANQTVKAFNYTAVNGNAGFAYEGSIPDLDTGYTLPINSTTNFLPINGGGFSQLSTMWNYANALFHPNDTFWKFDNDGLDFSCTSQLNTSIANSWGGSWTKNSP